MNLLYYSAISSSSVLRASIICIFPWHFGNVPGNIRKNGNETSVKVRKMDEEPINKCDAVHHHYYNVRREPCRDAKSCVSRATIAILMWLLLISNICAFCSWDAMYAISAETVYYFYICTVCLWDAKYCVSTLVVANNKQRILINNYDGASPVETQNIASHEQVLRYWQWFLLLKTFEAFACETQYFASLL